MLVVEVVNTFSERLKAVGFIKCILNSKKMKTLILTVTGIFILAYITGVFAYASFDLNTWDKEGRINCAIVALMFSLLACIMIPIHKSMFGNDKPNR